MTVHSLNTKRASRSAESRVAAQDWRALVSELNMQGCAVMPGLLTAEECAEIASLYPHEEHFRSHVIMARHGFGKGEYRYFTYPLPDLIEGLRTALYP
ncbi:MAG: proline hydroxylase, partial [Mesorhizobium sp.]